MATPAFIPGYNRGVTFQLTGSGAAAVLNVKSWSWEEEVKKLVTTHSASGGVEAMIPGVLRGEGTVEANMDSANVFHGGANAVTAGAKGVLRVDLGLTNPFAIPCMVAKVNWKSAVDDLVTYNFQVGLDSSTGSYTRAS